MTTATDTLNAAYAALVNGLVEDAIDALELVREEDERTFDMDPEFADMSIADRNMWIDEWHREEWLARCGA